MVRIAHARRDERGKYSGGKAGDQDGKEVCVTNWYNRPWDHIIRCLDSVAREKIARAAEAAAANDNIGYDQGDRLSLYAALEENGFSFEKINKKVECDCSSLVAACVAAAGIDVPSDLWTGSLRKALIKTKKFVEVVGPVLTEPDMCQRGDIWLYEGHHVAIQIDYGKYVKLYPKGWHRDKVGWWYANTENTFYFDCWQDINRRRYYFDGRGYLVTGLQKIDNKLYYFMDAPANSSISNLDGMLMTADQTGVLTPLIV